VDPSPPTPELELREILRHVGDAITVQAPSGGLLFANEAAAELLGFASPAELVSAPTDELMGRFELLDADGRPLPLAELPGRRAVAGEASVESLVRFRRRDSDLDHWSLVRATRVERDGALQYVINAFQDVSALKRRENELRLLAEAGEVLGGSTDYQHTLAQLAQLVVPRLADWCVVDIFEADGLRRVAIAHTDPAKIALAEEVQRRYPPDPKAGAMRVVTTGEPMLVTEVTEEMLVAGAQDAEHLEMLRALGLQSALVMPLAARGTVLGAITLIRSASQAPYTEADLPFITELARRAGIAVDNARLLHEATESVRLRDDFLATASHDMRTPLATILGYLQIAQRHVRAVPDPGRLPDFLARAERTAVRLARLVAELMDLSLIRAGQALPLALEQIDLNELVEGSLQEHRALSDSHQLIRDAAGEVTVVSDPSRIHRILDNLVGNALKYSEYGSTVTVGTRIDDGDAVLWVEDHGVGIPADELPKVFERFHRASTSVGSPGVGLGLAGSRNVARQLGGDLTAESVVGEGSTFTLRIPRTPPTEVAKRATDG
jgi:PAS domain S-box-containing protein